MWGAASAPTMVPPGCTWYRIVRRREKPRVFGKLSTTHGEIKVTVLPSRRVPPSGNGSQHGGRHNRHCKARGKVRSPFSRSIAPASKPWLGPDLHVVGSRGLGPQPEPARSSPFPNAPALLKASPEHLLLIEFAFAEAPTAPSSCRGARR